MKFVSDQLNIGLGQALIPACIIILLQTSRSTAQQTAHSDWSPCSVCCTQYRDPIVVNPDARTNTSLEIEMVGHDQREYRACDGGACPLDCTVSLWSEWTSCTLSHRWRNRTRYFVHPSDALQLACGNMTTIEVEYCKEDQIKTVLCSIYLSWSPWQGTCSCDSTVFQYQQRSRRCRAPLGLEDEVATRPCLSANSPQRLLDTECNRPLSYTCEPRRFRSPPWSEWECDATCNGTVAVSEGIARRRRAIGVRQSDSDGAQFDLAVCNCPLRFELARCMKDCSSPAATVMMQMTTPPFDHTALPTSDLSMSLGETSPPPARSIPPTDGGGNESSPSQSMGDLLRPHPSRQPIEHYRIVLSVVGVVLTVMTFCITLLAYKTYYQYKLNKKLMATMLEAAEGASEDTTEQDIPAQQSHDTEDTGTPSTLMNGTSTDNTSSTVFVNPHYGSSLRYPNYRDVYAESPLSSAYEVTSQNEGQRTNWRVMSGGTNQSVPNNHRLPERDGLPHPTIGSSPQEGRSRRRNLLKKHFRNPTHGSTASSSDASSILMPRMGSTWMAKPRDDRTDSNLSWASSTDDSASRLPSFRKRKCNLRSQAFTDAVTLVPPVGTVATIAEHAPRQEIRRRRSWS